MKKSLIAACFAVALTGFAAKSRVVVLHTNDTHTHIDDGRVAFSEIAAEKARLEAEGENVILVDAGDYVQGTALGPATTCRARPSVATTRAVARSTS